MDDDRPLDSDTSGTVTGEEPAAPGAAAARSWSNLWQVPTVLVSLVAIALGVRVAMERAPQDDFDAALTEVEQLLDAGYHDSAGELLRDDLAAKGPVRISDVESAQKEILTIARRMADAGEIHLGGSGEAMI